MSIYLRHNLKVNLLETLSIRFVDTITKNNTSSNNRVPPRIRGQLAARRLLRPRPHQPRRHVRLALDLVHVESVMRRVFDVEKDVVMLGRPTAFGLAAVVVRPDDLVDEALSPEDLIQQNLAVMHLAVVDVEVQAAGGFEQPVSFLQPRGQESQEIVEDIQVTLRAQLDSLVALLSRGHGLQE